MNDSIMLNVETQDSAAGIAVVPPDFLAAQLALVEAFHDLPDPTPETIEAHDTFAAKVRGLRTRLEKCRKDAVAEPLRQQREVNDLARRIDTGLAHMQDVAVAAVDSVRRLVAEQQRVAEEKRLRAEQEALERERQLAEARAALEGQTALFGAPADDAVAELAELERSAREASGAAMAELLDAPPDLGKLSVGSRRNVEVEVFDDAAVPAYLHGALLRPVDRKAVKALLKAGIEVPGAKLVDVTSATVRGR